MSRYRTPLRYPGGKQKLAPFISEILEANDMIGGHYVEPYAGGAGVALELLLDNKVSKIHLNDCSVPVYAFWRSILSKPEEFCRLISSASLTVDEWKRRREIVRQPKGHSQLEVGFSAFYLNRCNRSGVLSAGLIGGLEQSGEWKMDARFPRNELIRRIELIASRSSAIVLKNWDAERFMVDHVASLPLETLVYCDPPYFEKASRLYLNSYCEEDHRRISNTIQNDLGRRWVVSYDNAPQIVEYYSNRRSFVYDLQYNASRVYKGKEVFVFSDDLTLPRSSSLRYIDEVIQGYDEVMPVVNYERPERAHAEV
ncbi:DNA adenine methylase [Burkholderia cenocepacia]|uniref:DNA adenine methylase n=1 Tax=Burkholderia cenocepacia TaxID=95486 RepID=UPI00098146D7|nr:DNA adenine methylase [Burkholderia cenocepacia]AQQ28876.1 DNA methyltransferase [Burkholderia cenocepacia]ONV84237.1 DNA methyltransferase [Burkholderia cenocepacia]ONW07669.1 DNA methyltransferase [Burkholderia cenocepacia]ONW18576.1 DNA methyltransferase [Burkholderia cenocepacia]ONW34145.1 DNA methyltransferase [Burkholderia cenocepacia]